MLKATLRSEFRCECLAYDTCLNKFCTGIRQAFDEEYLQPPNTEDFQNLLRLGGGIPKRPQRQPPVAHPGGGRLLLPMDLACIFRCGWIEQQLERALLFLSLNDVLRGVAPTVDIKANDRQYRIWYYFADGTYPRYVTCVKTLNMPQEPKRILFCATSRGGSGRCQKSVRGSSSLIQHCEGPNSDVIRKQSYRRHLRMYYLAPHDCL